MKANLLTIFTLWQRELVRFYRQPSRVVGALGSPLLFWVVIGSGLGRSFRTGDSPMNYLEYFFPGTILMILLFTAIFSTISLIEDRREGFFQSVLVAPVSRASIVLGKILGGATLALTQACLFLLLGPLVGVALSAIQMIQVTGVLFLCAFSLTGLGFLIAWQFNSVQGFHAIMNLVLMPLWLLSGALFPAGGAFGWVQGIMKINPLSYQNDALRQILFPVYFKNLGGATLSLCLTVTVFFAAATFMASVLAASAPNKETIK